MARDPDVWRNKQTLADASLLVHNDQMKNSVLKAGIRSKSNRLNKAKNDTHPLQTASELPQVETQTNDYMNNFSLMRSLHHRKMRSYTSGRQLAQGQSGFTSERAPDRFGHKLNKIDTCAQLNTMSADHRGQNCEETSACGICPRIHPPKSMGLFASCLCTLVLML